MANLPWLITLTGAAVFMTALVRVIAFRERWGVASWAVVYLGSALSLGLIWTLSMR